MYPSIALFNIVFIKCINRIGTCLFQFDTYLRYNYYIYYYFNSKNITLKWVFRNIFQFELSMTIACECILWHVYLLYNDNFYIMRTVLQYPFFWYNICSAKWIRNDTTADIRTLPSNVERQKNAGLIQYDVISKTAYKKIAQGCQSGTLLILTTNNPI